jgi:signal transduction histidine kinase
MIEQPNQFPHATSARRARILAVDDSPTYLSFLRAQLREESYDIETAPSGELAIALLRKESFDCVIVDMVMPGTNGITMCREIDGMRTQGIAHPMILMLTASEDSAGLTSALEAGADDFVGKMSEMSVLRMRIRALLRRKLYEEENQRILAALKDKQLQCERTRLEKEAAEARAALVEELEQTACDLRRSNEELERFAYVASHDLQEPLRMVASYLQLLEERLDDRLQDEDREFMAYATNGARRMKSLICDLLEYSRIGTRGKPLQPTNTNDVMQDALMNLHAAIDESNARIECDTLPEVMADRMQLCQVFQNLIGNAIKFRSDATPSVNIRADDAGDAWLFRVQDNGIGIDRKFHERVFVVFQRLHRSDEYPGTGIGLSICKKIIERHGGQIAIESTAGAGAVFTFTLPKVHSEQAHERIAA